MKAFVRAGCCAVTLWTGAALAREDSPPRADRARDVTVDTRTRENQADTGLYALVGGGAEGYTGQLAPAVNPGFAYGATVGYRPLPFVGVEVGYNGGLSDIDPGGDGGVADGADVVRNAGQLNIVGNLTDTKLQPYVLTGLGVDHFNVRDDVEGGALGFNDDTSGYVPAGLGVRYQLGDLITADARAHYNFLFGQDFAPTTRDPALGDGRLSVMLSLGGTY
ncbi:MAG TPA: hypothetical protein VE153_41490 [Myxococcus sp.]|nr:hypothetical protein [Myxococcus sp.]